VRNTIAMVILMLCSVCALAQLPDAPQPQLSITRETYPYGTKTYTLKEPARGKKKLLALVAADIFAVSADVYDVRNSEAAFKRGYIESNSWLVGKHPSARALYARDLGLELSLCNVPSVLAYVFRRTALYYGFTSAPVAFGIRHFQPTKENQ
jgi:hypothetical protein